jgi:N-acetylglutamate synthase-like GNAT family acetyltransferase
MIQEYRKDQYLVSTDFSKLDIELIYDFLTKSYWAKGISKETVTRSIKNSLPFGVYEGDRLIGFARVITDYATFAYISDVFILESHRGMDLSKWLMECILSHPNLKGLRRWNLYTSNAADFYRKYGFTELKHPERYMEIFKPDIYQKKESRT